MRGFTLVEVLVALLIMAVMAGLAWRGIDAIVRSRDGSEASVDRSIRLSTILAQWEQDLQALHDDPNVPALSFDGQTLRLTRRGDGGVQLVAWSLRGTRWLRWVSPTVTRVNDLQQAWLQSQQLQGDEPGQLVLLDGVRTWQIYFYRGNAWTNAQSSGDLVVVPVPNAAEGAEGTATAPTAAENLARTRVLLPAGVRLVIDIDGQPLTRDIELGPQSQ